ncbi:hypothetical protein NDU88_008861 [Pleurodeles waltl]|uniref:Uncharacterized protein n=1 Tax=Pleurodeles waltl TaxID=8319 RepID=A0AAV7P0G1_PLEWA|nr:hypothetical protein NDU88_008861 [Pleurodeles waltl]
MLCDQAAVVFYKVYIFLEEIKSCDMLGGCGCFFVPLHGSCLTVLQLLGNLRERCLVKRKRDNCSTKMDKQMSEHMQAVTKCQSTHLLSLVRPKDWRH